MVTRALAWAVLFASLVFVRESARRAQRDRDYMPDDVIRRLRREGGL